MAPLWLVATVLSLAAAAVPQDDKPAGESPAVSCGAPPARQVVCYWEDAAPLDSLDACMCSQVVFVRGSEYAPDNATLQLPPEVRVASQALRRRNPDLRTLVRIPVRSADAKSPARRQRLADNLLSMVRKGGLHGAELVLEEQNEQETKVIVPRAALTATVQVIRGQLATLAATVSAVESVSVSSHSRIRRRAKRSYDVTERQVEDELPATWRPPLRRLRPLFALPISATPNEGATTFLGLTAASTADRKTTSAMTTQETTEPTVTDDDGDNTESTESLASYTVSRKSFTVSTSKSSTSASPGTSSTVGTSTAAAEKTSKKPTDEVGAKNDSDEDGITVSSEDTDETAPETEETAATVPMSATSTTTQKPPTVATPSTASTSKNQPSKRTTRAFDHGDNEYGDDYENDDWNYDDYEGDDRQGRQHNDDFDDQEEIINPDVMPSVLLLLRLPAKPDKIAKHYDLKSLSKFVDWFTLPTHNLTDASENGQAFHPSRLMGLSDTLNTDALVDLVTGMGAPSEKVIVTVPSFALKFTLADTAKNTPRSAVISPPAKLDRDELCSMLAIGNWTLERDTDLTAPYAFRQDSWIAFEDDASIKIKTKYVVLRSLGGIGLETADGDAWRSNNKAGHDICSTNGGRLLPGLHQGLTEVTRRRRGAVLADLQNDLLEGSATSIYTEGVHSSPFRITRLVDRQGDVHAIRENTQVEFECSRQGYFSHPRGCNRFYRCVKFNQLVDDYTVFEFDCPPGLAFDETVEVCVWPGSLRDGGACTGSSEIAPVPRSRFVCPSVEGFYADPENCRWFFACMDHARDGLSPLTAYEFRCPFGLVFDAETLLCDWPWRVVSCGGGRAGLITFNSAGIQQYNGAYTTGSAAYLGGQGTGIYGSGFGAKLSGDAYGRNANAYVLNNGLQGNVVQQRVSLQSLGLTAPGVASYAVGDDVSGSNVQSIGTAGTYSASGAGATGSSGIYSVGSETAGSNINQVSGLSLLSPQDEGDSGNYRIQSQRPSGFAYSSTAGQLRSAVSTGSGVAYTSGSAGLGYTSGAGASKGGFSYSTVVGDGNAYIGNGASGVSGQTAYAAVPAVPSGSYSFGQGYSEGRSNVLAYGDGSASGAYVVPKVQQQVVQTIKSAPFVEVSGPQAVTTGLSYEVNKGLLGQAQYVTPVPSVSYQQHVVSTPSNAYVPVESVTPSTVSSTYSEGIKYQTVTPLPTVQPAVAVQTGINGLSLEHSSLNGYSKPQSFQSVIGLYNNPVTEVSAISNAPVTRTDYIVSSTPAPVTSGFVVSSTPAPVTRTDYVVSSTPASVSSFSGPEYLPPKEATVQTVEYKAPQISTIQPVQTYQQVQSVTAKPAVVYQEVYQAKPIQSVQYNAPQVSTIQPALPTVQSYQQVQSVTAKPSVVYQNVYQQTKPVQTVQYNAPQVSTIQPLLPTVQTYQQVQPVTVKPDVAYQEVYQARPVQTVQYSAPQVSTIQPVLPTIQTYQQVQPVTAKPAVAYQEVYQAKPVQTIQYKAPQVSTIQPIFPTVQTYQQVQPVTPKESYVYQQVYQAKPAQPVSYEYTRPAVSTYQQVQTVTSKPEIVQQVQPVEFRNPTVVVNEQVQTVTTKPEIIQEVRPVRPISYEFKSPAVATYQQTQTVVANPQTYQTSQIHHSYQPAQGVAVEYKTPEVKHYYQYNPSVQYQQQYAQGGEYQAGLKYQEVQQINNAAQSNSETYRLTQPQVRVQLSNPAPFVQTYQQKTALPTIRAQEVVYNYNAPSAVPIRQKETHTVELPNIQQYQTYQQINEVGQVAAVTPVAPVSVKNNLYPFVKSPVQPSYVQQTVYSTPAPAQYSTVNQGSSIQYTSSGASNIQSGSQYGISSSTPISVSKTIVSQAAPVTYVSSTPASVIVSNDGASGAYSTATIKECTTCGSSGADLRVSTTPATTQYVSTVSTTPTPPTAVQFSYQTPSIPTQPKFVDVQGYYVQNRTDFRYNTGGFSNLADNNLPGDGSALYFLQPQRVRERPAGLDVTYYSTPRPAVSTLEQTSYTVSPTPQKVFVDVPNPEIRYQTEVKSTLRPIVVAEVSTPAPQVYQEIDSVQPTPGVIRTELKQEIPFQQQYLQPEITRTDLSYGVRTKPKVVSEYSYAANGLPTISTPASLQVESYQSTVAPAVDIYSTPQPTLPPRRLRPTTAVPVVNTGYVQDSQVQHEYAGGYGGAVSSEEQYLTGLVSQGISEGFGQKANAGVVSTSYDGQYFAGGVVPSTGVIASNEYEDGYVRNTLRAKPKEGRKKTKIVIVTRLTDVNPLLIGKLGAQCSCARRRLNLKGRRPGLRKVVRIIRPSTTGDVYSSTTAGYAEVSSSSTERLKSSEFEEDLALIRDSEREDDDDQPISSSTTPATISSSTTFASRTRGPSRYRGRDDYYQAGKAKSTIYVSSTEDPQQEDDDDGNDYDSDVELAPSREYDNAVQIPSRATQTRRRGLDVKTSVSSNSVPKSQTVDLGVQGTVECMRPGLFRHPQLCNKFYSCNWDSWKKKYVVNVFNCPIHLAYDSSLGACNWPSKGPACVNGKLLV